MEPLVITMEALHGKLAKAVSSLYKLCAQYELRVSPRRYGDHPSFRLTYEEKVLHGSVGVVAMPALS